MDACYEKISPLMENIPLMYAPSNTLFQYKALLENISNTKRIASVLKETVLTDIWSMSYINFGGPYQ